MRGRRALACASLLVLVACAPAPSRKDAQPASPPVWPKPPDEARFRYEYTIRHVGDIEPRSRETSIRESILGTSTADIPAFEKPAAIASRNGRIYVTDSARRHVVAFDVPRRRVFRFGLRPPGTLIKPAGVAIDGEMNVYVADTGRRQVVVYDNLGLFRQTIGDGKLLERPTGVAVNAEGTRVYVIDRSENDSEAHRVVVFDGNGNRLREIGSRGSGPGQFNIPVQGAVARDGTLFVLDAGNFRVQSFDPEGRFLGSFGRTGIGLGEFSRPRGVAIDGDGNVYVSDANFGNVQVFSPRGELLISIGQASTRDGPGLYGLVGGIAVDETGRLYVADQLFSKVEIVRRTGAWERPPARLPE